MSDPGPKQRLLVFHAKAHIASISLNVVDNVYQCCYFILHI